MFEDDIFVICYNFSQNSVNKYFQDENAHPKLNSLDKLITFGLFPFLLKRRLLNENKDFLAVLIKPILPAKNGIRHSHSRHYNKALSTKGDRRINRIFT